MKLLHALKEDHSRCGSVFVPAYIEKPYSMLNELRSKSEDSCVAQYESSYSRRSSERERERDIIRIKRATRSRVKCGARDRVYSNYTCRGIRGECRRFSCGGGGPHDCRDRATRTTTLKKPRAHIRTQTDSMSKEILATLDQQSDSSNSFYNHHNNHYNHQDQMQQQLSSSMNSSQQQHQQQQQQQQQQMQQMQQQQQQQSQQQQQRVPPTYVYSTEHHHHSHLYHNQRNDNLDDVEVDVDDENNHHDLYHQHNNRHNNHNHHHNNHDGEPPSSQQQQQQQQHNNYRNQLAEDQLGPLPLNWEKAFTETGEVYFIE
ncbi:unnamed protein product [Trichogramma brassicae]|uniref:WW domain-containing protein n=1 Tax=Trichogramma brassicae TaxID=86971 RepID=A0A6H5IZD5_9HYME|nr:unnamed protein product [Trichogramma brassicae]